MFIFVPRPIRLTAYFFTIAIYMAIFAPLISYSTETLALDIHNRDASVEPVLNQHREIVGVGHQEQQYVRGRHVNKEQDEKFALNGVEDRGSEREIIIKQWDGGGKRIV